MTAFSAAIRLVCLIDGRAEDALLNVVVFWSEDWDDAFQKAVELGRGHERAYSNASGEHVEWCFAEVLTLDELGPALDGRTVYSYRTYPSRRR